MKPQSRLYAVHLWLKDFGYNRKVLHAIDAYAAADTVRDFMFAKYGDGTEFYITRVNPAEEDDD